MKKKAFRYICLLCLSFIAAGTINAQGMTGDTDGDNIVTIVDALRTAQYATGIAVPNFNAALADVNGDKVVNILDSLVISQYAVGIIKVFPVDIKILLGDVNGDLTINIVDALQVSQYYIGLAVPGFIAGAGDVDGNGIIDIIDALLIARYCVRQITAFPTITATATPAPSIAPPYNLAAVRNYLDLDAEEEACLQNNGFVVLDSKGISDTLTASYTRLINQWDVPAFITSDALLHVFHITFADMLTRVESLYLYPRLKTLIDALDAAVANEYPGLTAGSDLQIAAGNLRVFTAVARALVNGETAFTGTATVDIANQVNDLLTKIYDSTVVEPAPGGEDYTKYKVRSHYTASENLKRYFRTMKWLQRKRFYIVNENFPSEQDNALLIAAILSHLVIEDSSTLEVQWEWLYTFNTKITGTIPSLTPLLINNALVKVFGADYSSRGYTLLSAAANRTLLRNELKSSAYPAEKFVQFMGEPYLMDEDAFRSVLAPNIQGRNIPAGLDMAAMLLNSNPAFELLQNEEAAFPGFLQKLGNKALAVTDWPQTKWISTVNNYWYYTLRSLSNPVSGVTPPWMLRTSWLREKMNTQLSSWVELHNDYVNMEIAAITPSPTPPVTPTPTPTATLPPTAVPGVGGVCISPASLTVSTGAAAVLDVRVNSGSQTVAAYGLRITYSSDLLAVNTAIGISGVEAGADGFVSAVNANTPGTLVVSGFDTAGKGPGANLQLLKINLTAGTRNGVGIIGLIVDSLVDVYYNTIGTPSGTGGTVTITGGGTNPPTTPPTLTRTTTRIATRTRTATPAPTPTHMPGFVEPYPAFFTRLAGMCNNVIVLLDASEITLEHKNRFTDIYNWAVQFGECARKIGNNESLTDQEYLAVKNWGPQLNNFFTAGTITPESAAKTQVIADFFSYNGRVMHIATGKLHPVVILYRVRNLSESYAAVGYVLSYYEIPRENSYRITDEEWAVLLEANAIADPEWRNEFWLD